VYEQISLAKNVKEQHTNEPSGPEANQHLKVSL